MFQQTLRLGVPRRILLMRTANLVIWSVLAILMASSKGTAADPPPSFNKDVMPVLTKYCFACHTAGTAKGGISLDSFAALTKMGKKGTLVVASKPEESLLVKVVTGQGKLMPPKKSKERPTEAEIAKVKVWITAGAKDDTARTSLERETVLSMVAGFNQPLPARRGSFFDH